MNKFSSFMLSALVLASVGCANKGVTQATNTVTEVASIAPGISSEREKLIEKIDAVFADERFERAIWARKVQDLDTGEVWYDRMGEKLVMPASNEKIPTTAAALTYLGKDFQFETEVKYRGAIEDGTLNGDLMVTSNGDPTIYSHPTTRFYDDARDLFRLWAKNMKSQGITHISGDIIGDDDQWQDSHVHWSWPEDKSAWYYAEFGALQMNENYVDFTISAPDSMDGKVTITGNVPSNYYQVVNNIKVVADGNTSVRSSRKMGTNTITFSGQMPVGASSIEQSPTITNPTLWYVTVLKETLEEEGITVGGSPVDIDDLSDDATEGEWETLGTARSPKLLEILRSLMKRSQNNYAESMVMTMGWKENGTGTLRGGQQIVRRQLDMMGIPKDSYIYSDGSGLSRYDYVSPDMIIMINEWMYESEYFEDWFSTYPVAGIDGTLRSRMKGTAAAENVRGKTGNISNTRALSGYVRTKSDKFLAYSFIVNNHTQSSSLCDQLIDEALVLIAEYEGE